MKKLCVLFVFVILAMIFFPENLQAGPPVIGGSGNTLPEGWYFENHVIWVRFDRIWANGDWKELSDSQEVFLSKNLSQIYFSVSEVFDLRLNLLFYPTVNNGLKQQKHHYLWGDIIFDSKLRLLKREGFAISMISGLSFATGDKRLRPFDSDKTFIDFSNGYALVTEYGKISFHHYLFYWYKTADIPDYFQYNFAIK